MHELSIALSIIEGVEEEIARRNGAHVTAVHLKLGPLSGVVKDALLFSFAVACEGTQLAGSKLEIEETPVVLYCPVCEQERPAISISNLCCNICGTPSADIRKGSELEVFALELIDEHATTAR
jgi:hydrogenase nickel incorporation protein HypA/HybF